MIRMLTRLAIFAVACPLTSIGAQDAPHSSQTGWQTVHQDLEVTISPDTRRLTVAGNMRVRLGGTEDDVMRGAKLALDRMLSVP